jgi:smoothened protein
MKTKVASRSRGSKSKSRSSRHQRRADFTSKRYSRKESSTSMESQVLALTQKGAHSSGMTDPSAGMLVPMNHHKRRSGIGELSPEQINDLIAKNRFLLPYLTTSEDEKSSIGSFNIQESKLDAILKQIGLSEHKIIENKLNSDQNDDIESIGEEMHTKQIENYSDLSSKENLASALRGSKNLNRSIGSKKGFKTGSTSRARKGRKSSRSVTRNANPLTVTNGSGKMKMDKKSDRKSKEIRKSQEESYNSMCIELSPLNGNLHGSLSGRSDIGIQTEMAGHTMSSMEFAENLMKQDRNDRDDEDDDDAMENYKLLPKRTSFSTAATKQLRDTNEISLTESEKLKLLLLPSK